jgi:hypothetical protein
VASHEVKSLVTRRFWRLLHALPAEIQALATRNYLIWQQNPNRVTIRIGDHYRALGVVSSETVTWVWIGTHSEYNRLVDGSG